MQNSSEIKKTIGQRLSAARKKEGVSRKLLCDTVNKLAEKDRRKFPLHEATLKQWELGNNQINIEWLPYLCAALHCDTGYIFGEYESRTRKVNDIREQTGLSECAILNLEKNAGGYWEALNSILESETFWQFLKLMETYKATGVSGNSLGEYVEGRIRSAAVDLLPDPEERDVDIFTDSFYQSVCNRYCWLLLENYKRPRSDASEKK